MAYYKERVFNRKLLEITVIPGSKIKHLLNASSFLKKESGNSNATKHKLHGITQCKILITRRWSKQAFHAFNQIFSICCIVF